MWQRKIIKSAFTLSGYCHILASLSCFKGNPESWWPKAHSSQLGSSFFSSQHIPDPCSLFSWTSSFKRPQPSCPSTRELGQLVPDAHFLLSRPRDWGGSWRRGVSTGGARRHGSPEERERFWCASSGWSRTGSPTRCFLQLSFSFNEKLLSGATLTAACQPHLS